MSVAAPAILDHAPLLVLAAARLGGLVVFGPVIGARVIPVRLRVGIVVILAVAVAPVLVGGGTPAPTWSALPVAVVLEFALGMLLGFLAALPLVAAQMGGLLAGQQMGFGFAGLYGGPTEQGETDVLGKFLFLVTIVGFLVIGGHEALVLSAMHSFDYVPPGAILAGTGIASVLAGALLAAFDLALRVAAPVLAIGLAQSLAVGFVARTVPQMNILSLGFPIRLLAGALAVVLVLPVLDDVLIDGVDGALRGLMDWMEVAHA